MQNPRRASAIVLAATTMLAACGGHGGRQQQHGPMALNVDVARATQQTIATYLPLDGQIAPLEESTLSFQQSGPIAAIYVNQGDRVTAGELVARIDPATLQAQLAQAEAQAAQARAQAESSRLTVPITQTQTSQAMQSAKAALQSAQLTYNQDQSLYKQGYVSLSQLQSAQSAYVAAKTQYETAVGNQQNTKVSGSQAQAAGAAYQAAEANVNTLKTEISQTALYAPYDGVVTARLTDPGAMASPSVPVLKIANINPVWVNVNVPDNDLQYVHTGTRVTFTVGQLGNRQFTGRIDTVNATPTQGTLSYEAQIREPNPNDELRGGMLVSVTVQTARAVNATVVPRAAIGQTDSGSNVFIVGPGKKAELVPVRVGLQTDTLSQVFSPKIQPGTIVITTRPDALQNGSPVAYGNGGGQ